VLLVGDVLLPLPPLRAVPALALEGPAARARILAVGTGFTSPVDLGALHAPRDDLRRGFQFGLRAARRDVLQAFLQRVFLVGEVLLPLPPLRGVLALALEGPAACARVLAVGTGRASHVDFWAHLALLLLHTSFALLAPCHAILPPCHAFLPRCHALLPPSLALASARSKSTFEPPAFHRHHVLHHFHESALSDTRLRTLPHGSAVTIASENKHCTLGNLKRCG